ncbi:MAG: CoA transferase, partial [Frankiaceae bacterium]|nr:CoA transferase [Frankiaceae bacterium]
MLEGVRVVELATWVAGPSAAAVMADWGATVIKVESGSGDATRRAGVADASASPVFEFENRGKRGVVLDIGAEAGREALIRMLGDADIFITNLRPRSLQRARLDYDSLKDQLPHLVYCS